jgi:hypothetical protein
MEPNTRRSENPSHRPDHPLSINRRPYGFTRAQAQRANRFLIRREKKIESGIAPPQMPGGATIVSREKISTLKD